MDARICRNRCLQAMVDAVDPKTRQSLWKAAKRYGERMRDEASTAGLKTAGSPLIAHGLEWGMGNARDNV